MTEDRNTLNEEGQARRRFLKQAGTVAWASPFILTMMSRTAHAQAVVCGTQDLSSLCELTGTPCGSTQVCVPDGIPSPGGDCICASL